MSLKKIGYCVVGFGVFIVLASLVVDYFGIGKAGIQSAQLLGIQFGVILAAIGLGFVYYQQAEEVSMKSFINAFYEKILKLPTIVWIMVGFLIAYICLFIFPMFLNPDH